MPARAQDPPDLGEDALGLLEMVQDVDAPDEAEGPVGYGEVGAVGNRGRRLAAGDRGARRVVLEPHRPQPGGGHTPQPVAAATAQVEHRPAHPEGPEVLLDPGVQRRFGVAGGAPARSGKRRGGRPQRSGRRLERMPQPKHPRDR